MIRGRTPVRGMLVMVCALTVVAAAETSLFAGDVQTIAARGQKALFLISAGKGDGTGFLISRDPPLVVTVGHLVSKVEKPEEIVVRTNETETLRKVRALHIHKGFKEDGGGKNPYSPDLALLELETAKDALGPPLMLAREKPGEDLRGAAIVSMGFPNYTLYGKERESPEAVTRRGIVRRLQDYDGSTTSPLLKRPMFEHDLDVLVGESGSPMMLATSGTVIGIQVGTRRFTKKDTKELIVALSVGVHVRELWVLLDQVGMTKVVSAEK